MPESKTFSPEFKVIVADSAESAMVQLTEGGYEGVLVVGVKAGSLPEVPIVRQFFKDALAKLLTNILIDITADAGGKVNA